MVAYLRSRLWCCCLVLGVVGLSVQSAHASGTCYQWRFSASINATGFTSPTAWADSPSAGLNQYISACNAAPLSCGGGANCTSPHTCTYSGSVSLNGNFPNYTATITGQNENGATFHPAGTVASQANPEGCAECPASGTQINVKADQNLSDGASACVGGCEITYQSSYLKIVLGGSAQRVAARGTSTGKACSQSSTGSNSSNTGTANDCSSSGGNLVCAQQPPAKCGEVNGDVVCPQVIKPGTCVSYASGGIACASDAPTQPTNPTTPPTAATPVAQVSSQGETVNYYDSSTVTNSTTNVTTTAPQGGSPTGSSGSGAGGTGSGGSSVSGGAGCDAAPVCSGDAVECAVLNQEWLTRCPPVVSADDMRSAVGLGDGDTPTAFANKYGTIDLASQLDANGFLGSRSCPADIAINLGAYGTTTFSLADKCVYLQMIGALVLAVGGFFAARIAVGGF